MNDIKIRPLYGPDLTTGLCEVLSALAPVNLSDEALSWVFWKRLQQGWRSFVAVKDGRLIGTASMLIEHKFIRGTGKGGKVAHIEDVAVHVDYQRQGIGQMLLEHIIDVAKLENCYKAILSCLPDNIPFYERLGFAKHGATCRLDL